MDACKVVASKTYLKCFSFELKRQQRRLANERPKLFNTHLKTQKKYPSEHTKAPSEKCATAAFDDSGRLDEAPKQALADS